jgi:hypothetical protein
MISFSLYTTVDRTTGGFALVFRGQASGRGDGGTGGEAGGLLPAMTFKLTIPASTMIRMVNTRTTGKQQQKQLIAVAALSESGVAVCAYTGPAEAAMNRTGAAATKMKNRDFPAISLTSAVIQYDQ